MMDRICKQMAKITCIFVMGSSTLHYVLSIIINPIDFRFSLSFPRPELYIFVAGCTDFYL